MNEEKPQSIWRKPFRGWVWFALVIVSVFLILFCFSLANSQKSIVENAFYSLILAVVIALGGTVVLLAIRWLTRWRNLRRVLFAAACLLTLLALFLTEENLRGKRAWENHRRSLEAKGEPFTLASLIPPPVPDQKNFALTPLLKPVLDFTHTPQGVRWRDTNAYARVQRIRADLSDGADRPTIDRIIGNLDKGTLTDLEACRTFYRTNSQYPQPATPGTAAEDVLVALGKFDAELNELREAAATRPQCRFPVEYQFEPTFAILLPHLSCVKGIAMVLQVRAIARLENRQANEAFQDLQLGFRLSDCISNEPLLIDHLVRLATLKIGLQAVREGLVRHAWTDAQLAEVEKYFSSLNLLAEYKLAMRGERALGVQGLDYYRRRGHSADFFEVVAENGGGGPARFGGIFNAIAGGFYYQNMRTISEMHERFTFAVVNEQARRIYPEIAQNLDQEVDRLRQRPFLHPYKIFSILLMPALSAVSARTGQAQSLIDGARVACALERFRLANGTLPEKLEALVPQFLRAIPNDVIDGRPLRYHRTADGGYVVYSVGWNGVDDGGTSGTGQDPVDKSGASIRTVFKSGDWVWSLPGK